MSEGVRVRGAATAEEVAAVLAVLSAQPAPAQAADDGYGRGRAVRRRALRSTGESHRPA